MDDLFLTLLTFVPLAGAIVMMVIPKEQEELHKQLSLIHI